MVPEYSHVHFILFGSRSFFLSFIFCELALLACLMHLTLLLSEHLKKSGGRNLMRSMPSAQQSLFKAHANQRACLYT